MRTPRRRAPRARERRPLTVGDRRRGRERVRRGRVRLAPAVVLLALVAVVVVELVGGASSTQATVALGGAAPKPEPKSKPKLNAKLTAASGSLLPVSAGQSLRSHIGQHVVARGIKVTELTADDGFWVGSNNRQRVFVQLHNEQPPHVMPGERVSFRGEMQPRPPDVSRPGGPQSNQQRRQGAFVLINGLRRG